MFCPNVQRFLKPIYDLTRKGSPFKWTKMQQKTFEEIKTRLLKPPVLNLLYSKGRFQLFSDTIKTVEGSSLYKIQNGNPKLIAMQVKGYHLQQQII